MRQVKFQWRLEVSTVLAEAQLMWPISFQLSNEENRWLPNYKLLQTLLEVKKCLSMF